MWISYSDSEVNVFHPVCEEALQLALKKLKLDKKYSVIHHQYTGSLEMDFVIKNNNTNKYLCVVEVKRTPADVHSARYQYQAMSYVQMNAAESEKPFYILTNLEYAFSFRYESSRSRVFQQMLKPGLYSICSFDEEKELFIKQLTDFFAEQIDAFVNNEYEYLITLDQFAEHMERIKNNPKRWKTDLAALLYEYIRGSFTYMSRNELKDIRVFRNDISKICNEAVKVNFKDIFTYSEDRFEKSFSIDNDILTNLYDFGYQNITGDSVAGILHQIVSSGHEHEGEVPTDLELGRVVAILAKDISGELEKEDMLSDPAAGSGNLISSAIEIFNLLPTQIYANDVNKQLIELLSLRLGLNYSKTIKKTNSPTITCSSISDLSAKDFENVKVVVMNPPFVAGIYCVERKVDLYSAIKNISGRSAVTDLGQMPLEGVFLELVCHLLKPGTTIACVFPKTHLMATGREATVIRKIILNLFGLNTIFTYPGGEIFDDVTRDTCVLVGRVKNPSETIRVISSYETVPNIDNHRFMKALKEINSDDFVGIMPGVVAKAIDSKELSSLVERGWHSLNSEISDAILYYEHNFVGNEKLEFFSDYSIPMKRGGAGNSGASDLIFIDSRPELFEYAKTLGVKTKAGMRNAKSDDFVLSHGDSYFFDIQDNPPSIVSDVITEYMAAPSKEGKQAKKEKTKEQLENILVRESRGSFLGSSVLIPRNIRRNGRIYISNGEIFVSTNFVVCTMPTKKESFILASWMTTVFYQLICELYSKDQEGARKMEVTDIMNTLVPKMESISEETYNKIKKELKNVSFLDLNNPVIRDIDLIWAEELFGSGSAMEKTEEARDLLEYLGNRRNTM